MEAPDPGNCFLYINDTIIQQPFSHKGLTQTFVTEAKTFLKEQTEKEKPFFLYVPFVHNHVALYEGTDLNLPSRRGKHNINLEALLFVPGKSSSNYARFLLFLC